MSISLLPFANSDESLIRFVDQMMNDAIQQSASDIHIEPNAKYCRIRMRIDGLLIESSHIHSEIGLRLITLLKVMAKLNIAEKRLPQDGRFEVQDIDIRVNICPTLFGEKMVLRLLNSNKMRLDFDELGMNSVQKNSLIDAISKPQGSILIAGPTGSGKTITLYSILSYLNTSQKNISTVEDPVEITLPGINQVSINQKIGLDFANLLRTLLRQDPDILMIGEIRDRETAEIAVQAALTGHLILSTVHAHNAYEVIARLMALGIQPFYLVSAISLMVSQRLLRKLCDACKIKDYSAEDHVTYRAQGCEKCFNGYKGRCAVYEFLPMTDKLADCIFKYSSCHSFDIENTLIDAAMKLVFSGITSLGEVKRVLGNSKLDPALSHRKS